MKITARDIVAIIVTIGGLILVGLEVVDFPTFAALLFGLLAPSPLDRPEVVPDAGEP